MDKLDELIKEALSEEQKQILEGTEELGWFALGLKQFQGKLGWVTWVVMLVQGTMFLIGVWFAVLCYGAVDVLAAVKYGLTAATLIIVASSLKFSLMPQLQADRVLRELKRVELLIAHKQGG